jgi:nucleolar complex protein 3
MLKTLREFGHDPSIRIRKLALLTQLAVYKDIVPGYRVRIVSDKEAAGAISKDVRILRMYEQGLLSNYQAYLQSLDVTIKGSSYI